MDGIEEELAEVVRSVRAWVEWTRDSGVLEVPVERQYERDLNELGWVGLGMGSVSGPRRSPHRERPSEELALARPVEPAAAHHSKVAAHPIPAERPRGAGLALEERRKELGLLAEEARTCSRCRLHEWRTQSVFSRGSPDAEIVFVGEGPGFHEDQQGKPFVGPAGQLLDRMIGAMGMTPDEVYICNAVKCRPPENRKPEPDEMAACAPFLQRQLDLIAPKVIVALGATGVQALLGTTAGITRIRGTWKLYKGRIPVMPTFHPAYLLRSPEKKREVWEDLKQVLERLGRQPPTRRRS